MTMTHRMQPSTAGMPSGGGFTTRMPETRLGKVSFWLAIAFAVGFVLNMGLVGVVGTSTDAVVDEFARTYLPYWGVALMSTGFAAGVVAVLAILRQHERSIVTLLTVVPALFVIVFLLGEFLMPH